MLKLKVSNSLILNVIAKLTDHPWVRLLPNFWSTLNKCLIAFYGNLQPNTLPTSTHFALLLVFIISVTCLPIWEYLILLIKLLPGFIFSFSPCTEIVAPQKNGYKWLFPHNVYSLAPCRLWYIVLKNEYICEWTNIKYLTYTSNYWDNTNFL